ncbi:hypothetical protein D3C71_1013700 [compost metagenome]
MSRRSTRSCGAPVSKACSTVIHSLMPQRRRTCTATRTKRPLVSAGSGERSLMAQLRLSGLAWRAASSSRCTNREVASSAEPSGMKPGCSANACCACCRCCATCGACCNWAPMRCWRSCRLSICASTASIGCVHSGCTTSRYTTPITASSRPRASQRSRRVGCGAIGDLLSGRQQFGGQGETFALAATAGLQHAGQ